MTKMRRVLIVENIKTLRQQYATGLKLVGFEVDEARNLEEAISLIDQKTFHVALVDLMLNDPNDSELQGIEVLDAIERVGEGTAAIVISGQEATQTAIDTMHIHGARYYVAKSKLLDSGINYLTQLVLEVADSVEINKYGKAKSIMPFLSSSDGDPRNWEYKSQKTVEPQDGYMGLMRFLEGFCDRLAPLLPLHGAKERLIIRSEEKLLAGKFWSKALGMPVLLIVTNSKNAASIVSREPGLEQSEEYLVQEPYRSYGLVGYVFLLKDAERSQFISGLER